MIGTSANGGSVHRLLLRLLIMKLFSSQYKLNKALAQFSSRLIKFQIRSISINSNKRVLINNPISFELLWFNRHDFLKFLNTRPPHFHVWQINRRNTISKTKKWSNFQKFVQCLTTLYISRKCYLVLCSISKYWGLRFVKTLLCCINYCFILLSPCSNNDQRITFKTNLKDRK